ncbi:hypothetical protein C4E44_23930 [Pseudomonas sp. MWU12-2312b]|nr:hypothetical protein C4E44_23930 [Pseudomonas sp. MWU12-2312b]
MADRGGPTEQDRSEGMPSTSEAPNDRGKSAWLLGACPSDPPSGRNPRWPLQQQWICTPERKWSAVRPPSLAGQLPQGNGHVRKKMVGCQAAIAGKPAAIGECVHQEEHGRLSGRHRWQASSHRGMCTPERKWSAVRPRSLAGQLPQGERVHQKKMVGHKAVFAGKPAPTGTAPTRKKHASHEAAIASKPAHKGIRS